MKKYLMFIILLATFFIATPMLFANKQSQSDKEDQTKGSEDRKPLYAIVGGQDRSLTPFPNDEATRKIIVRSDLQKEGDLLATRGFYEEAIVKFRESMNPALLNYDRDIAGGKEGISRVYQRQGKYEESLKEYQWFIDANKNGPFAKDQSDRYANTVLDKKLELEALIQFKKTSSFKPVYDHIRYLKEKYKKYIPPKSFGDSGFHSIPINDIIHLYDYLGDANGGIQFMEEVLKSKFISTFERAEYERVKQAFKEDKRTGQRGHLQKVIETSDYIGW